VPGVPPKFTPDEIPELKRRYLAGETSVDLGKAYGCCPKTIAKHLKLNGVRMRRKGERLILLDVDAILEDYRDGMRLLDIAEKYSVSATTIQARLRQAGEQPRTAWHYEAARPRVLGGEERFTIKDSLLRSFLEAHDAAVTPAPHVIVATRWILSTAKAARTWAKD
tara:strand:+ start:4677 stop:5174 length:498 start_codon:yes stop_codon:yes gene_type:complete